MSMGPCPSDRCVFSVAALLGSRGRHMRRVRTLLASATPYESLNSGRFALDDDGLKRKEAEEQLQRTEHCKLRAEGRFTLVPTLSQFLRLLRRFEVTGSLASLRSVSQFSPEPRRLTPFPKLNSGLSPHALLSFPLNRGTTTRAAQPPSLRSGWPGDSVRFSKQKPRLPSSPSTSDRPPAGQPPQ